MIDSSINGSFTESTYDESTLSALDSKLNRYLTSSVISSRNLSAEKDKIKSLISDISHQTKTPIANILLYSQLLSEHKELPEECNELVNQISTQTEKLNFLIGALIKTSRLETGIISVSPNSNSVDELVSAVLTQTITKAEDKNITITSKLSNGKASFDMKWTQEALCNIIDNAIKYTEKGGNILITSTPYELFYRIDITDNGIGIEASELNKLFGRFYRCQNVRQYEGVGIGLFLAREILSAEGGYIKVKSKIGEGSTFSIFLPK